MKIWILERRKQTWRTNDCGQYLNEPLWSGPQTHCQLSLELPGDTFGQLDDQGKCMCQVPVNVTPLIIIVYFIIITALPMSGVQTEVPHARLFHQNLTFIVHFLSCSVVLFFRQKKKI